MSSFVNWFHKRRSLPEVQLKTKRSVKNKDGQTGREIRGRASVTERPITLKKQMSLPGNHNCAYFYLESNQDFNFCGDLHDPVFDGSDLDVFDSNRPFIKSHHRKYSDLSQPGKALFYEAKWLQHGPIVPRNSTASGNLVFQRSFSQPCRTRDKVTRRKSDSLFNYIPKAFGDQDASKILMGEKNEDARRPPRKPASVKSPDCETRQPQPQPAARQPQPAARLSGGAEIRKQGSNKDNDGERPPSRTGSGSGDIFSKLGQDPNLDDGHFYFTPSVLMGRPAKCGDCLVESDATRDVNVAVAEQRGESDTNDNDYNINNKSADDEVSAILKEFENIDRYNGNYGGTVHLDNTLNQEFLY